MSASPLQAGPARARGRRRARAPAPAPPPDRRERRRASDAGGAAGIRQAAGVLPAEAAVKRCEQPAQEGVARAGRVDSLHGPGGHEALEALGRDGAARRAVGHHHGRVPEARAHGPRHRQRVRIGAGHELARRRLGGLEQIRRAQHGVERRLVTELGERIRGWDVEIDHGGDAGLARDRERLARRVQRELRDLGREPPRAPDRLPRDGAGRARRSSPRWRPAPCRWRARRRRRRRSPPPRSRSPRARDRARCRAGPSPRAGSGRSRRRPAGRRSRPAARARPPSPGG